MATVYRAHDERLAREVAIKVLLPNLAADQAVATRFEREARTLAAVAHPGVVSVFDVDPGDATVGREPFFVMELCPGGSLAERMAGGWRLAPDELVPILVSVADGLAGLHARGVVHRDVKPSNILFAPDRAKLADFGLARSDDGAGPSDLTTPGTVAGTLAYLAPEVLAGEPAAASADIYALGVAAFSGLTGSLPRPATSLAELVSTARDPAPRVSVAAPDLGQAFDEAIAAALDPDATGRPDALAFASWLTAALGRWRRMGPPGAAVIAPMTQASVDSEATTAAVIPIASSQVSSRVDGRKGRRRPRWLPAAAGATLLALAMGLWAYIGSGRSGGVPAEPSQPTATVVTRPSPTVAPSLTPSPPTAATVLAQALAALDEVDAAIANTTGRDGLKGKERKELVRLARNVRSSLESGDRATARTAAGELADEVDRVDDELDEEPAGRLADAVESLVERLAAG